MDVIRRRDYHRVDVVILDVQHPPEVFVFCSFRVAPEHPAGMTPVHVTQRHDVLALERLNIAAAPAAGANGSDVEFIARRRPAGSSQNMPWNNRERRCGCRRSHKITP